MDLNPSKPQRVLVAGLSPAWQQILVFDEFHAGEVNRAREVHWCASGKVLNVGIALAHLGHIENGFESRILSVIGGPARALIESEFNELEMDCRWVETARPTRICTTILDRATSRTTELVENAATLSVDEVARFRGAFCEEATAADVVVLTGSLPSGVPTTFFRELLQHTKARTILDIRGPELLAALDCNPFLVKPNREELSKTFNRALTTDEELHAAMRELNARGARWVVVTQGVNAVWASNDGAVYRFDPPHVPNVVNPIGSGDCLAAGIAWSTARGIDPLKAISFGIAAAADNVGQLLPGRIQHTTIEQFLPCVTPKAV
jgi:1-phosphofructokinase family hexose kinase